MDGENNKVALDKTLSDKEIARRIRETVLEKAEDLRSVLANIGFSRPVIIHDIKLMDGRWKSRRDVFKRIAVRLRKKLTHVQDYKGWLLNL